jgi:hypothetical protein
MTILDKIVATKREELTEAKKLFPKSMLLERPLFHAPKHSVTEAIKVPAILQESLQSLKDDHLQRAG